MMLSIYTRIIDNSVPVWYNGENADESAPDALQIRYCHREVTMNSIRTLSPRFLCRAAALLLALLFVSAACACSGGTTEQGSGTSEPDAADTGTQPDAETSAEPVGTDTEPAEELTEELTEAATEPETEEVETTPAWDTDPCKLYVATDGNDANDGSEGAPFATLDAAIAAVRGIDKSAYTSITVYVAPGDYRVNQLSFLAADSGTENCIVTYRAEKRGTAVLNGGVSIPYASFSPVTDDEILSRLPESVRDSVRCFDLTTLGLTAADWGKLHAIGSYNTAAYYDGDYVGDSGCEIFFNDTRMTLARYPNGKDLQTGKPAAVGYNASNPDFESCRNPQGDTFTLDKTLTERVASWKTLDGVWMYGFWMYDWADASTPIESFDPATRHLTTKLVSRYGIRQGAPYYFYNVLEELDEAGEWYIDRDKGILYLLPPKGMTDGTVDIAVTGKSPISVWKAEWLCFDGFVVCGARTSGISVNGSHCTVRRCLVKNVSAHGIVAEGSDLTMYRNEVSHVGGGGIIVSGGDTRTLTPSHNVVDNNYIHDWAEITKTYQAGVGLYGVGGTASHNELENAPHLGIFYDGNDHIIEYNIIRNVCQLSSDAGAIYAGASWTDYGTVIRYNIIDSPGSASYKPNGIYFDDALSGQTAYGNILINVPGNAFLIGGGRDNAVYNNIIIARQGKAICYDARAIDGILRGGWFTAAHGGGTLWQGLNAVPWQDTVWQTAYPAMSSWSADFGDPNDPAFLPNPAGSRVTGNLIVTRSNAAEPIGDIAAPVKQYSDVSGNAFVNYRTGTLEALFVSAGTGDYTLKPDSEAREKLPDFVDIPCADIGRYGW